MRTFKYKLSGEANNIFTLAFTFCLTLDLTALLNYLNAKCVVFILFSEGVLYTFRRILRLVNYVGSSYKRLETSSQLSLWDYITVGYGQGLFCVKMLAGKSGGPVHVYLCVSLFCAHICMKPWLRPEGQGECSVFLEIVMQTDVFISERRSQRAPSILTDNLCTLILLGRPPCLWERISSPADNLD